MRPVASGMRVWQDSPHLKREAGAYRMKDRTPGSTIQYRRMTADDLPAAHMVRYVLSEQDVRKAVK